MNPPSEVVVSPHTYRILVDNDHMLYNSARHGHTDIGRLVISLNGSQAPTQLADTLLHELTHAMTEVLGLDEELDERIAARLGSALLDLLIKNPELIKYIQSLEK